MVLSCTKCEDTGWFAYDCNHSAPCNLCCPHQSGVWELTEGYGNEGMWCCLDGCGEVWGTEVDYILGRPSVDGAWPRKSSSNAGEIVEDWHWPRSAEIVEDWHGRAANS